ncbi:MAG: hypothetical protein EOO38_18770, partial [Cytophagaceae bacterium]
GAGGRGSRPAVIIHGNVHAREWITSMTTEYFAYQLLTKYASDASVKALVDKFDFYITPIVNPDGFAYSQTTDRLWRKNRQTVSGNTCVGRDINRNWPYKWEVAGGASTNPCSETYKGVQPGDSPENLGLRTQVNQLRDSRGIRLYLDVHSYGQYILYVFGQPHHLVNLLTRFQVAIRLRLQSPCREQRSASVHCHTCPSCYSRRIRHTIHHRTQLLDFVCDYR